MRTIAAVVVLSSILCQIACGADKRHADSKTQTDYVPANQDANYEWISANEQIGKDGTTVAVGGLGVPNLKPGATIEFGRPGPGFWKTTEGKTATISCFDKKGKALAFIKIAGRIEWNAERQITRGKVGFLSLKLLAAAHGESDIVKSRRTKQGLVITTKDGNTYFLYSFDSNFTAMIEPY